jgi:capsular polysaccharide transport system permease protein
MFSVWRALFLREALYRLTSTRSAALWLFFEPVFHVSWTLVVYTVIRMRTVNGIDTVMWLLTGILTFTVFKRVFAQTTKSVDANMSLFTYRQVKPIDTLMVRAILEAFIVFICGAILFFLVGLAGHDIWPTNPLQVMLAVFGLWIFALSWGMAASVAENLVPEFAQISKIVTTPMYVMSGTIIPLTRVRQPYQDFLMYNPIAHALELVRQGFSPYYHVADFTSMAYLYSWAVGLLFLGLILQRRFALRLTTQ